MSSSCQLVHIQQFTLKFRISKMQVEIFKMNLVIVCFLAFTVCVSAQQTMPLTSIYNVGIDPLRGILQAIPDNIGKQMTTQAIKFGEDIAGMGDIVNSFGKWMVGLIRKSTVSSC